VDASVPGEAGAEVFDVNLDPRPIGGDKVEGIPRSSQTRTVRSPSAC